jgi:predicted aspartyl protease
MSHRLALVLALLACAHAAPSTGGGDPAAVLARFKAATGGSRWDSVRSIQTQGTAELGGLRGPVETLQDARTGRSVTHYQIGPLAGAEGFDGNVSWEKSAGGEVTSLDSPDVRKRARTQAWLNAMAYWYPERGRAVFGELRTEQIEGKALRLFEATPEGGDSITLGFDEAGLLVRTTERQQADSVITTYGDYREVSGVLLPFSVVVDRTDAVGKVETRLRQELRLERVSLDVPVAEDAFRMPAMAAGARITDPSGVTTVPIELENNHIYADALVDGKKVRVIVDTGGVNLLTPASAKRLGITAEGKLAAAGVGEERADLALAHGREVRLGSAVLENPVFYVIDLGTLPAAEGTEIDGLVGFEMFRRFRVTIDYAAKTLTLADPARFKPPEGAHVVPFDLADRIPIVTGTLDGLPVRITVDTGSRSSLTLHGPFVKQHGLVERYGAASETVVGWGVGGPSRGRPARLGTLTLGDVAVKGIAGDLFTGTKGSFANPDHSGNLGGGVLRRFTVAFDYDAKKMYLAPNQDFGRPDAYDRSGLFLFEDEDGKALRVMAVAAGSAGERAGLAADDRIEGVDGEPARSRRLSQWRARLRELPPGTRLVLQVKRGGAERKVTLVLADVIPDRAP